ASRQSFRHGRQSRRQRGQPLPSGRPRGRVPAGREPHRPRDGDLLVDRRQRFLCPAVDLVQRAARQPHRQRLRAMSDAVAAFVTARLGHAAKDMALFERALTHSSTGPESYERLEFLGDRVLGLVIARALYDRYPNEPEGHLSKRFNALVARETCAEVGRTLGLPELIRLGKQARSDGANLSDNVVGDVVEALIGALLLDGGMEPAQRFVRAAW